MAELLLEQAVVGYPGFRTRPLDLRAGRGVVLLAGENGSGKTTLLRCCAGEAPPLAGRIEIDGLNPHRSHLARRYVALVPSSPELPDALTVGESWRIAAGLRGAPGWDGQSMLEALGLPETLPLAHASAGQKIRCELLCALAGDPAILLLDETFAHLDREAQELLAVWIRQWADERLVIVSHHGEPPFDYQDMVTISPEVP